MQGAESPKYLHITLYEPFGIHLVLPWSRLNFFSLSLHCSLKISFSLMVAMTITIKLELAERIKLFLSCDQAN